MCSCHWREGQDIERWTSRLSMFRLYTKGHMSCLRICWTFLKRTDSILLCPMIGEWYRRAWLHWNWMMRLPCSGSRALDVVCSIDRIQMWIMVVRASGWLCLAMMWFLQSFCSYLHVCCVGTKVYIFCQTSLKMHFYPYILFFFPFHSSLRL